MKATAFCRCSVPILAHFAVKLLSAGVVFFGQELLASSDDTPASIREKSERGDPVAQCELAWLLYRGTQVPQDYDEAYKWWRKASEQGHVTSQRTLGFMYSRWGPRKDDEQGAKWFRKAAEQGDAASQYELGCMCQGGRGQPKDMAEAMKWFRKAAEQDYAEAQSTLGFILKNGEYKSGPLTFNQGVRKNPEESRRWFQRALESHLRLAEKGEWRSLDYLARAYENGYGIQKDLDESAKWYQKLAEFWRKKADEGDTGGLFFLAGLYEAGKGVRKDEARALFLYRAAAERGDAGAQFQLGVSFESGKWGAPKDFIQAYMWYNLAAARGYSLAEMSRDQIALEMTPEQIAEGQRRSAAFVAKKHDSQAESGSTTSHTSDLKASGSGFFLTSRGHICTCNHVVEGANRIIIKTTRGDYPAVLVKVDSANDLAILKVEGDFSALPTTPSGGVRLGESVFTVGFPNIGLQGFAPKLTKGEISSLSGAQDDPRHFQVSVPVQPGNSGGPLLNQNGSVIGIVKARLSDLAALDATGSLPQNVNYAIKTSVLAVLLENLAEVTAELKETPPAGERKFEEVVKDAEQATVLVLVY